MKWIITTMAVCGLLTGASQGIAQDQKAKEQSPGIKSEETKVIKATVQKIDKEKRKVKLKGEDGKTVTVKVPETARNFDQIKPGDVVTAKYTESIAVAVRKSDEPPSATGRESLTRAPLGEKPGFERTAMVRINATIEKIDRDKRELSLMGPEGNTTSVKVPADIKKFDELKEGDQVVINATESVAIEVSSPEK
jgi:translation initiation factor IF-1